MHVLILQHIENEHAGSIIDYLNETGADYRYVKLYDGESLPETLEGVSHVIVMGGTMNVYEEEKYPFLIDENGFIQKVLSEGIPFLGICLGGQLLAKACGAAVTRAPHGETGVSEIELNLDAGRDKLGILKRLPKKFPTVQWHGDTFAIPEGGTLLATSKLCKNQAFKTGENAYGMQFHPEVTEELISGWFDDVDYKDEILKDFSSVLKEYKDIAYRIYEEFFK